MFRCGLRRLIAWISRRLLTWLEDKQLIAWADKVHTGGSDNIPISCRLTSSALLKELFMHFMAWKVPVVMFCALITSLNVPSPFFAIIRYFLMISREGTRSEFLKKTKPRSIMKPILTLYSKLLSPETSYRWLFINTGQLHSNCRPLPVFQRLQNHLLSSRWNWEHSQTLKIQGFPHNPRSSALPEREELRKRHQVKVKVKVKVGNIRILTIDWRWFTHSSSWKIM